MKKTRILIADDHAVCRKGVEAILGASPELEICGEAATGREAVDAAARLNPDLVVMDVCMPVMNGLEAARQILKRNPRMEILILSMHDSDRLIRDVLACGARGYVLKTDAGDHLLAAVDALRRHQPFFTSKIAEVVLRGFLSAPGSAGPFESALSSREREIVQLVAEGRSNKEIATSLQVTIKTVETHRARVMRKLGLHSIAELVRYAIRNNMIEC